MVGDRLKYIISFLNTRICEWYFRTIAGTSGVGTRRWIKIYVDQLCIPNDISFETEKQLMSLVDQIQDNKIKKHDTQTLEIEIEEIFFNIFDFTTDEINEIRAITL